MTKRTRSFDNLMPPRIEVSPRGTVCFQFVLQTTKPENRPGQKCLQRATGDRVEEDEHRKRKDERQEEEKEEEDCPRDLPGSEGILDHTESVLAVGAGWNCDKDGRQPTDRNLQTRTRGATGAFKQHRPKSGASESHARSFTLAQGWPGKEIGEKIDEEF